MDSVITHVLRYEKQAVTTKNRQSRTGGVGGGDAGLGFFMDSMISVFSVSAPGTRETCFGNNALSCQIHSTVFMTSARGGGGSPPNFWGNFCFFPCSPLEFLNDFFC